MLRGCGSSAACKYSRGVSAVRLWDSLVRFAQVTGVLHALEDGYRIVVTLDTKTAIRTVRDELVPHLLMHNGVPDADWTADQLTQETIGTTLAEQGWEAVSQQPQQESGEWAPPMASYLVRS